MLVPWFLKMEREVMDNTKPHLLSEGSLPDAKGSSGFKFRLIHRTFFRKEARFSDIEGGLRMESSVFESSKPNSRVISTISVLTLNIETKFLYFHHS